MNLDGKLAAHDSDWYHLLKVVPPQVKASLKKYTNILGNSRHKHPRAPRIPQVTEVTMSSALQPTCYTTWYRWYWSINVTQYHQAVISGSWHPRLVVPPTLEDSAVGPLYK